MHGQTADRTRLFVLVTMNCESPGDRKNPDAPRTWEQSARSIDGFCTRVLAAGFPPTLFVSPSCCDEQEPLLTDAAQRGAELGLYIHPPQIGDGRFAKMLGQYAPDDQRTLIDYGAGRFAEAFGHRPRSFRGGFFSASDATYRQLFELGFRQGSLSEPGRRLAMREAVWVDAPHDAHYVDPERKAREGTMPFLELPVTTDPRLEAARGVPMTMQVEAGPLDLVHRPTLEYHLGRMEEAQVRFRSICIYTSNRPDYYRDEETHTKTLEGLLALLETLGEQYELTPVTAAGAHEHYRAVARAPGAP